MAIGAPVVALITALGRPGYSTRYCCQGEPASNDQGELLAYIMFSTQVDAALAGPFT